MLQHPSHICFFKIYIALTFSDTPLYADTQCALVLHLLVEIS